jgi:sugar/nucleoside kinase (ribokinase family)
MLYGIHEGWELERSMRFANAMAAVCLTDMTTSGGMKSVGETLQVMNELPLRTVRI